MCTVTSHEAWDFEAVLLINPSLAPSQTSQPVILFAHQLSPAWEVTVSAMQEIFDRRYPGLVSLQIRSNKDRLYVESPVRTMGCFAY
jgi:hypothetical protein